MSQVEFDEKKPDVILAMLSDLGERVGFEKPVTCSGGVEIWLNSLLFMVRDTIKTIIGQMATNLKEPDFDFVKNFALTCGQVNTKKIIIFR